MSKCIGDISLTSLIITPFNPLQSRIVGGLFFIFMFKAQAQAELLSQPAGALRTSSPSHAERHSEPDGAPRTSPAF